MPRTGDTYALPSQYLAVTGEAATAAQHNDPLEDLRDEQNLVRPVAHGGTGGATAAAARTALDVQQADAGLLSIAGLTTAADKMIYTTASDTYAVTGLTSAGRDFLGAADAEASFDVVSPTTTTGDMIYNDGANNVRLAIGTVFGQSLIRSAGGIPVWGGTIRPGTEQASTSGTAIDFTSLPAGIQRVTVMLVGVSTSGTSKLMVQIGDSGGVETTGYLGSAQSSTGATNFTTGFGLSNSIGATSVVHGKIILSVENLTARTWVGLSALGYSNAASVQSGGGSKSLSAALDRVRITTVGGSDTFDAGVINVTWEF